MEPNRSSEEWREILNAWRGSGQRRIDFCRDRKLKVTAFDYWRRKLLSPVKGSVKRFVRIVPSENLRSSRGGIIQLKVGQRYTLEFQEDIGEAHLMKILKVLLDLA